MHRYSARMPPIHNMPLTRKAPFDDLDRFFEKFVAVGIDFGTT